jgi:hypothetical protein
MIERVAAIVQPRALLPGAGERRLPPPAAGETLLLTLANAAGDDVLVTTANGMELRLVGLSRMTAGLRPGDTLMMQVLATEPRLELGFREPATASTQNTAGTQAPFLASPTAQAASLTTSGAPAALLTQHKSMQLDQAALRQIAWQLPDPAALASTWRALAREHWTRAPGHVGPEVDAAKAGTAALFRDRSFMPQALGQERWVLPVYAWAGMQLMLRLVVAIDRARHRPPRRRGLPLALQLAMAPPTLGSVVLHVQAIGGNDVELLIASDQRASLLAIQQALPGIGSALSRAGLRLRRAQITHGNALLSAVNQNSSQMLPPHVVVELPSASLFRAAAETAIVVLQLRPSPASR